MAISDICILVLHFIENTSGDSIRDASSFPRFPEMSGVEPAELAHWIDALEVTSVSALEWRWNEHWSVGPRIVKDSMWFCFLHGGGSGWVGNERNLFRYKAGDMVLLPQGVPHFVTQDEKTEPHLIAVHFFARIFGVFDIVQTIGIPNILHNSANLPHLRASQRIAREFALKPPGWRAVMDSEIRSLLLGMIRFHAKGCTLPMNIPSLAEFARFAPVFQLIDSRIEDPDLSVREMARVVFLSEVQFRKVFRGLTGTNPVCFLQRRRVERACRMLRTTTESVESIAEQCGFAQAPFFYRVFRRWTSVTPRSYRERQPV